MIPVQGNYGHLYYNNDSEIRLLRSEILGLQQQLREFESLRRDFELARNIIQDRFPRVWFEIDQIKSQMASTNIRTDQDVITQKKEKIAEIEDIRKYIPDLEHLHRQNLEKARDTSHE